MIKSDFIYSKSLGMDWVYTLYIPDDYENEKKYDVLILLHGTNGNNRTLIDRVPLEEMLKGNRDKIVILPNGFNSYYIGKVEDALIKDLIPFIDKKFNVENLIIGGVSMGGFGALRLTLRYPKLFKKAILISPAIWNPVPPVDSSVRKMCAFGQPFDEEKWIENSWTSNTENLKENSYILIHGKEDEIVEKHNIEKFVHYCLDKGIELEYYYVNGNHNSEVVKQGLEIAFKKIKNID